MTHPSLSHTLRVALLLSTCCVGCNKSEESGTASQQAELTPESASADPAREASAQHAPAPSAPEAAGSQVPEAQNERVTRLATEAIAPFKKQLAGALMTAMQDKGPAAAIEVCSKEAPRLAAEASSDQVKVGRSALKLRNPANAAQDWLKPVLTELAALSSAEGAQRVVAIDDQHYGYAEAITLKPLCATCHGTSIAPELAKKIKERYPDDQATGFEPGQLRGVFWAEVLLARND